LKPLLKEPIALKKANNNHESAGLKKWLPAKKTSAHNLSLRLLQNDASILLDVPLRVQHLSGLHAREHVGDVL